MMISLPTDTKAAALAAALAQMEAAFGPKKPPPPPKQFRALPEPEDIARPNFGTPEMLAKSHLAIETSERARRIVARVYGPFDTGKAVHGFYAPLGFVAACRRNAAWTAMRKHVYARLLEKAA